MNESLWQTIVSFLFGAGGATVLQWLLRRRSQNATILAKQQEVIESLWRRIDALQARVDELEAEVDRIAKEAQQLRRLLHAYERRFGRRFRIGPGGKVVDLDDEGG